MNESHLEFICNKLHLGSTIDTPISIYGSRGGSLMWRVNTDKKSYAIKQLSPDIDLTQQKMITKYNLSEEIAEHFFELKIPAICAIPAIKNSKQYLIIIENIGYLVCPWIEGYTLGRNEISQTHALKIAEVIAKLHKLNLQVPETTPPRFDKYSNNEIIEAINKLASAKPLIAKILQDNIDLILSANKRYLNSIPILKEQSVVTHGDIDQLNVIWDKANQPILIDWESARQLNPTREIVRSCLAWSGLGTENFSLSTYNKMLKTYIKSGGILNQHHINAGLFSAFGSMIFWMLYNIDIVCNIDDVIKIDIAINEINETLTSMISLDELVPDLIKQRS
jgi:thiamine kinase-like enzyme